MFILALLAVAALVAAIVTGHVIFWIGFAAIVGYVALRLAVGRRRMRQMQDRLGGWQP